MTLVVAFQEDDRIIALADSRITRGGNTATDAGAKIFTVPILCRSLTPESSDDTSAHSVGLAFAGSTLLAANCHNITSTLTQSLYADGKSALPSLAAVARLYAAVAEYLTKDLNSRLPLKESSYIHMFVFGYCKVLQRLEIHLVFPDLESGRFEMKIDTVVPNMGNAYAIGNGASAFANLSEKLTSELFPPSVTQVFRKIVESNSVEGVGGHIQTMDADSEGATIYPILEQSRDDPDKVAVTFLGFDISEYGDLDGLKIGKVVKGFAGTEKVFGRAALRARGIDPDGDAVSKEVQNLAAVEAALEVARTMATTVVVNERYTLAVIQPEPGQRYLVTFCNTCGARTPLCIDRAWVAGETVPIAGNGILRTVCPDCCSEVKASVENIRSSTW